MKWLKGIALLLIADVLFMVAINVIVSLVLPAFGITLGADTTSLLAIETTDRLRFPRILVRPPSNVSQTSRCCSADLSPSQT